MTVKKAILAGMHGAGVIGLSRRLRTAHFLGATVLLYHRVLPAGAPRDHYSALMGDPTVPQLQALIEYLKRWYRFATPAECVARWQRGEDLEPYTLLLTFDDGYADLHDNLMPLLSRCEVPATVFVTTGAIGGRPTWFQRAFAALEQANRSTLPTFDDVAAMPIRSPVERAAAMEAVSAVQRRYPASVWEDVIDRLCDRLEWDGTIDGQRMMDWEQVGALHRSGWVTIGGHTVTHPCLETCAAEHARRELFDSAAELRARLPSLSFLPFAYPHGRCPTRDVQDAARAAGYGCAFTGQWAANTKETPLYALGRQHLPPGDLAKASLMLSPLAWMSGGRRDPEPQEMAVV